MILPFCGELLFHPAAVDYSGNTCSHNCCYCFANIRQPVRDAQFKSTLNLLNTYKDRKTLSKILIAEGFPICVSNKSDPLSETNWKQTFGLVPILNNLPNAIFYQTKGGKRWREFIDLIKPKKNVIVYITMTSFNDEVSAIIERGAPPPSERLEFARALRKEGIEVVVGLNPLVETWLPQADRNALENALHSAGVDKYVMQLLHFSRNDLAGFTEARKNAFAGLHVNAEVDKKNRRRVDYYFETLDYLNAKGNFVYACHTFEPSRYNNEIRKTLGKAMPTITDFINYAHTLKSGDLVTFNDFVNSVLCEDYMVEFFNKPIPRPADYIRQTYRDAWKGNIECQSSKTLKDILRIVWNNKYVKHSPQFCPLFKVDNQKDKDGNIVLIKA